MRKFFTKKNLAITTSILAFTASFCSDTSAITTPPDLTTILVTHPNAGITETRLNMLPMDKQKYIMGIINSIRSLDYNDGLAYNPGTNNVVILDMAKSQEEFVAGHKHQKGKKKTLHVIKRKKDGKLLVGSKEYMGKNPPADANGEVIIDLFELVDEKGKPVEQEAMNIDPAGNMAFIPNTRYIPGKKIPDKVKLTNEIINGYF